MDRSQTKIAWKGEVVSVQVKSVVWRYLACNRTHRETGYHLFIRGEARACDGDEPFVPFHLRSGFDLCIAISEKQQEKLGFRVGDTVRGTGWTPLYPETTFADFYRAGALKVLGRRMRDDPSPTRVQIDEGARFDGASVPRVFSSEYPGPPWVMAAPPLDVYGWRGARMLSLASWKAGCLPCVWAAMAEVTVEYDFDRGTVKNRFEPFCYGPLSCPRYRRGPARSVPYRGRESATDDGALDEICTDGRVSDDE